MLAAASIGLGLCLGWGSGGTLTRLATSQETSHGGIVLALFVTQAMARSTLPVPGPIAVALWSLACIGLLVVLRLQPGNRVLLIEAGFMLNLVVVLANEGMPYRIPQFWSQYQPQVAHFYVAANEAAKLVILGDVVPTPFGSLASAGDVLMAIGVAVFLCTSMISRP